MSPIISPSHATRHYRKVLVVSWNRMGDMLQLTPIFESFKKYSPETELHLTVSHKFEDVAKLIGGVSKIIPFNLNCVLEQVRSTDHTIQLHRMLTKFVDELRCEQYDLVLNVTHNRLTALFMHLLGVPESRGLLYDDHGYRAVRDPWSRFFFIADLIRGQSRINLVEIQLGIAGFHPDRPMRIEIPEEVQHRIDAEILSWSIATDKIVAIQIGASLPNKEWNHASFAEIARRLVANGFTPIWVGAPSELEKIESVAMNVPGSINLAGKTSVAELAAIMKRCRLLLTNDTGTMHVGVCVGTPIISLNVGTPLSHETGPYQAGSTVIEPKISCYPCSFHVECPHYRCHDEVDVDSVWSEVAKSLEIAVDYAISDRVRVWRTAFDENGFWELRRIKPEAATADELAAVMWAEIWKRFLAHRPIEKSLIEAIQLRFAREYTNDSIAPAFANLSERMSHLSKMVSIARSGIQIAEALRRLDPIRDVARIVELGKQLESIEQNLQLVGLVHHIWRPLFAIFVFGKDAMVGDSIDVLAKQTSELFQDFVTIGETMLDQSTNFSKRYSRPFDEPVHVCLPQ